VSKRSAECPEDDEDDCVYDMQANKNDNLLYPVTVITTRKPRQYACFIRFNVLAEAGPSFEFSRDGKYLRTRLTICYKE